MKEIASAREEYFKTGAEHGVSKDILKYIWDVQIKRQLGYSFSIPHTVAYSLIALQEMNLNILFPPIYWATACLTVNSGGADEESGGTTNYGKLSSAIGRIKKQGIDVMPVVNGKKVSLKTGNPTGRPPATFPDTWEKYYNEWRNGNITAKTCIEKLGLKRATFYKLVNKYEKEIINTDKES